MITRGLSRIHRVIIGIQLRKMGLVLGNSVVFHGRPIVTLVPGSSISISDRVVLTSDSRRTALGVARPIILRTMSPAASIEIGAESGLSGTTICAVHSVRLGRRVLVGADVMIADTDFHPVDVYPRTHVPLPPGDPSDRIDIEDDVFIGARSIILKGVHIGAGSVIGAGSLVTKDIPAQVVAGGWPAKVLRPLMSADGSGA